MPIKDTLFLASQYLAPHHLVSRLAGLLADSREPWLKNRLISNFVHSYGVNMSEALLEDALAYESFNTFFTRALKADARPLARDAGAVLCPTDGFMSQFGAIDRDRVFQAKGHSYSLNALLGGDAERAAPFTGGSFATIYLSPSDYHRVHMPVAGTLREMVYVPGRLFSVNPLTARNVPGLFARNERVVCLFDTEAYGPMAVVLVGAMIVASIETVWAGRVAPHRRAVRSTRYDPDATVPVRLDKGAEMGRFLLGSTVVVLFGPGRVRWAGDTAPGRTMRMGELLGLPA
ncbi:archaetidylserine decarboxylase [Bordetella genomosp. 13]|uniref:Phosphatidylserine decarboxylase proenzyme n=1 Tax=Bordetella genomosp. 13 TaxID=463040 RepID=A0A1W6ZB86_9BORD|nr:archaetidylserine decarboxylase [Bordetella genomosp. 13]ARP94104.1 phosphatidylserine decarboxylase [Bordetella genomosp. 13]